MIAETDFNNTQHQYFLRPLGCYKIFLHFFKKLLSLFF
ncbi:Hypothetical Protein SLY_0321 [Strawberry lethal yellows phytoplasma (CPA) str. NZSb11]|uniref:Uncharacterized protein n=1 Tax=Strawberry lethal yellows phytoplasma (CPA) str. NZSb11 TaxID=980422 RepID=R4S0F7_PHYAS|nr:Hypothetical Protein SLY_0321 [Strawberry lethal yellows phytoplasma (CPA) str. NZSb11]